MSCSNEGNSSRRGARKVSDSARPLALPAGLPGGGALFEDNKSGEGAARSEGAEERELQAGWEKKEGWGAGGRERGDERARGRESEGLRERGDRSVRSRSDG